MAEGVSGGAWGPARWLGALASGAFCFAAGWAAAHWWRSRARTLKPAARRGPAETSGPPDRGVEERARRWWWLETTPGARRVLNEAGEALGASLARELRRRPRRPVEEGDEDDEDGGSGAGGDAGGPEAGPDGGAWPRHG